MSIEIGRKGVDVSMHGPREERRQRDNRRRVSRPKSQRVTAQQIFSTSTFDSTVDALLETHKTWLATVGIEKAEGRIRQRRQQKRRKVSRVSTIVGWILLHKRKKDLFLGEVKNRERKGSGGGGSIDN